MTREEAWMRFMPSVITVNTQENEICKNCKMYYQYDQLDYGECKIGGCRFEVYPNNTCVYFVKSTEREG